MPLSATAARLRARFLGRSAVFRWTLLAGCIAWAALEAAGVLGSRAIRAGTYDFMQRHRLWATAPDPRIVVFDIDERSLAEMAPEFGRWPWPRDTLAAVLAHAEAAGAAAIVFDVLFSDPDRAHAGGDKAFEASVLASQHAYFPVVRLPPHNDARSRITLADVPGLAVGPGAEGRSIALILPFMRAVLDTRRLGTSTVKPDGDGVLRTFAFAQAHGGARVGSLPLAVARGLGEHRLDDSAERLIVWREHAGVYPRVPFVEAWRCAEKPAAPSCLDLRGRIVVIGATAPSLHDVESTPLKANHPGVDILATLIDNAIHARAFAPLTPWLRFGMAMLALGAAAAIVFRGRLSSIRIATFFLPALFATVGFVSLHSERVYLDLAMPAAIALTFLSGVGLYDALRARVFRIDRMPGEGTWGVACVGSDRTAERFQWCLYDAAAKSRCQVSALGRANESIIAPAWSVVGLADHDAAERLAAALPGRTGTWCRPFRASGRFPECLYRALADRHAAPASTEKTAYAI